MADGAPTVRHAARLILLDETSRVLLARFEYGGKRWWAAPGGDLDDDETHEQAALREIVEETGHLLGQLGPWLWTREHVFRFEERLYRQLERYFVAYVPAFDPRLQELDVEEAKALAGLRWWTLAELEEVEEKFAPADLPALVRALVEGGPPEQPIEVGAQPAIDPTSWKGSSPKFGVKGIDSCELPSTSGEAIGLLPVLDRCCVILFRS